MISVIGSLGSWAICDNTDGGKEYGVLRAFILTFLSC
ncbi:hypothetical protein NMYAN_210051 [Nitrosomonas nitrosa]|uniref:Uncharacterized protein n=1 Tax=Nitrosomonas nitrosa TaxID=52442 RepID=A0A8H8YZM3_9PROT|nr:hypothetical protein NMYAN_210051 [Nitrosomonas nitrosa]